METSIVPPNLSNRQMYVTHAEFQGCFIKIWALVYSKKRENLENNMQNYRTFTKEFTKLDIYGSTMYVYIWRTINYEEKVYRCEVISTDLVKQTHSIKLVDYGRLLDVPFSDVREVINDIDRSLLISLSQGTTVYSYLLTGYLSQRKSNKELHNILCNKYYKYQKDFEVSGVTFVSLFDVDKSLTERNLASVIDIAATITIAHSMSSTLYLSNKSDIDNSSISNKTVVLSSFPKHQYLDYSTIINVAVTRVSSFKNSLLLTVRTLENDSEVLTSILNSVDRKNLKLAPILEVHTPCLIILRNTLVRVIILEVEKDQLLVDLIDYGIRESVPRTGVFEIPSNCNMIEKQSLNVVIDIPPNFKVDKSMFLEKCFKMLPVKIDPSFGLYKVRLFNKKNGNLIDIYNPMSNIEVNSNEHSSTPSKSSELFSITEINDDSKENMEPDSCKSTLNHLNNFKVDNDNLEPIENETESLKDEKIADQRKFKENFNLINQENLDLSEKEPEIQIVPITFLKKENFIDEKEMICSLIHFESPFHFNVRKYNPSFESLMNLIKSVLNSRYILKKHELIKNMYVIYQNQSGSIYRAQIIDLDLEVDMIKLHLVDEGDKLAHENLSNMTLYNFIESDCVLPGQLVLDCSLDNMWFPIMNIDTILLLQPYFSKELLYNVQIVKSIENGINLVEMTVKNSNCNISDLILKSGIGQRLWAVMKTDETPYEEALLIGQCFQSYAFYEHRKLYIQPEPNTVNELEDEIQKYIEDHTNLEPLDVNYLQGTYCLATVDNNQWHRAYLRNISEDSIIVFMFDIGLLAELLSLNQIRPITYDLLKKPQLCLSCCLEKELNDFVINGVKTLYNVTVKSINDKGELCVEIEKPTDPLSNPIVRSLEQISYVHVDGDLSHLRRSQDNLNLEKMSQTLSKLYGKLDNKISIVQGSICVFENDGKYYRCLVKSINSEMAVVHCIDYGFEIQIKKKQLLSLLGYPQIFLSPALVISVKTFPMALDYNLSNTKFLAFISMDEEGKLNVLPNKMSLINQQNNKLIETLASGCLVKVTHVNSSDDCWIVPHLFLNDLEIISDTLVKMQSKVIPAAVEVGSLCAALHPVTKKWHRALLLEKNIENQFTLSIDSGELFEALKITKLASNIQKIPNCALHCQVVSNLDLEKLVNKDVKCKLISSDQPVLKVELFSEGLDKTEDVVPTQSLLECIIVICRFESFNEFYVQKVDDEQNTDIVVNTICHSTSADLSGNKSNGKLFYRCCLQNNILDDSLNDPETFSIVLDLMMNFEWTMTTYSEEEPYTVTLTRNGVNCIDIVYENLYFNNSEISVAEAEKSKQDDKFAEPTVENKPVDEFIEPTVESKPVDEYIEPTVESKPVDEYIEPTVESKLVDELIEPTVESKPVDEYIEPTVESKPDDDFVVPTGKSKLDDKVEESDSGDEYEDSKPDDEFVKSLVENSTIAMKNLKTSLDVETVTITHIVTFQYFYVHSDSLHESYMNRINDDLDVCIVQLPLNHNLIGSIVVTSSENMNCWCRAKIVQINSDCLSAYCYLLDYGTYENCNEFYTPTEFLSTCPPIVRRCSLYTPELVGKENEPWFFNLNSMFRDICTTAESLKFKMTIIRDGDPCSVTLQVDDADISKMLMPLNVYVLHVNSLVNFKVMALSDDQKAVTELLKRDDITMVLVKDPIIGDLYLARLSSKLKRVRFDELGGSKYVVVDIDDTLDKFSVDTLYALPEKIRNIPIFTLRCSFIFKNEEEEHMYSLKVFKKLAAAKINFTMCIITESDVATIPHLVKLYLGDKDALDLIIKKYLA